jgi:ferredoxin-NADP reductase
VSWQVASVVAVQEESDTARTISLSIAGWSGHLAGQHVDVRLTAEDGYTAVRSYSIASPAVGSADELSITVEESAEGEVSPFLVRELKVGDQLEIRGPVGGWFVWRPDQAGPTQLVAGGSGIVPVMSMLRTHRLVLHGSKMRLLYSTRSPDSVIYRAELGGSQVLYTRAAPSGSSRPARRLDATDVSEHAIPPADEPTCYICGPTGFVESASRLFLGIGYRAGSIRTERFGGGGR